jgi:dihydrofolate synthase / folylpolyglutamate synthase
VGFDEARAYLDSLGIDAMKAAAPSLHRMEAICAVLNHPERQTPAVHVTGTNGKTSTARIAASLLSAAGLGVATYTSPHLQTVRERLVRGEEPIPAADFGAVFDHLRPYVEHVEKDIGERLTFFEILTAMFFLWTAESPVDAAVVEVGLGGRWDATNVVNASVAVITNVGLDHTGLLGMERETIAKEKSGIIKPDAMVVTAERAPGVLAVIGEQAESAHARVAVLEKDFALIENRVAVGGRYLSVRTGDRDYEDVFLPLHGSHQGVNAAVALEAVTSFLPARSLDQDLVAEGFVRAQIPGRIETIRADDESSPPVVLDVAHNPDGMSALVTSLLEAFAFERVVFVLGILGDKDYRGMLAEIARVPSALIVTEAKSVRTVPPAELRDAAAELDLEATIVQDVGAATRAARARAQPGELVCITGSHYVVGEARTALLGAPDDGG